MLSLRTNVDPARTAGLTASYALRVGDLDLCARVVDGAFTVEPGTAAAPDAALSGSPEALAGLVYGGRDLEEAVRSGDVTVDGDVRAARRFPTLFILPDEAPTPAA